MAHKLKVADEVFLVVADLHRQHPDAEDFSVKEIVQHAQEMNLTGHLRPGFEIHVRQHSVANLPPNGGRYQTLVESGKSRRRLKRQSDPGHPLRDGKRFPDERELPGEYLDLLNWAKQEFGCQEKKSGLRLLLELRGSGKKLWADEPADEYVARLREGWD